MDKEGVEMDAGAAEGFREQVGSELLTQPLKSVQTVRGLCYRLQGCCYGRSDKRRDDRYSVMRD